MYAVRWFLAFLLLSLPLFANAEKDPGKELAKQIKGQTLLLRTSYDADILTFDEQGRIKENPVAGPFAWSAVHIDKAYVDHDLMGITGQRRLLVSTAPAGTSPTVDQVREIAVDERNVTISIDRDPAHPEALSAAFHNVFFSGITDALADKSAAEAKQLLADLPSLTAAPPTPESIRAPRLAEDITPPRVIYAVDPKLPSGLPKGTDSIVLLAMTVGVDGYPKNIRVVQPAVPANGTLDTNAVSSVSRYRFAPAEEHGVPIPVQVNIEVHFKVY